MKKTACILFAAMMLLSLAACKSKDTPAGPTAAPDMTVGPGSTGEAQATDQPATEEPDATPEPFTPQDPARAAYDPATDADNRYSIAEIALIEAEGGFYWYTANCDYLMFYDESLEEAIPVCAKPECEHFKDGNTGYQNKDCSAYLECVKHPSLYNGKLYFIDFYGGVNPNSNGTRMGGRLCRMDPDGTQREVLKDVYPPGLDDPDQMLVHRGMIYGTSHESRVENGEPIRKFRLLALPLEGDETTCRVLYEFDGQAWGGIRLIGDRCYFWVHYADGEYEEDEDGMVITDNLIPGGVIGYWDAAEEKLHILFDGTFPKGEVNYLYKMWVTPDETIYVVTQNGIGKLEDGEIKEVVSCADDEHEFTVPELSDGIMILRETHDRRYVPENDPIWWIMTYDGTTLYKAPLPMDWTEDMEWADKLRSKKGYAFSYIGGDETGIYVEFATDWTDLEGGVYQGTVLVRYDLVGGELIPNVLDTLYSGWAEDMG